MSGKQHRLILFSLLLLFTFALFALIRVASATYGAPAVGNEAGFGLFHDAPKIQSITQMAGAATATPFQPRPTITSTPTITSSPTATHTSTSTQTPTALPFNTTIPPTALFNGGLPDTAYIDGVFGYAQTYNLTCESRSAVDWARYFGTNIAELDFQAALTDSDNPEVGFVGYMDGTLGQIPPASYGVHAPPVADLLREYGLAARPVKDYTLDKLKKQIAKGNPVIVWVVGNVWYGEPVEYTAADGSIVTVAHYEHTAIVIGYDEYGLTFVDNDLVYWRSTDAFLNSWAVLGNMAIIKK